MTINMNNIIAPTIQCIVDVAIKAIVPAINKIKIAAIMSRT